MKSAAQASDKPTSASSYSSTLSASSTRLTVLGHQSAENARTPGQLWHIHLKQANPCFLLFRHPYGYMWIQSLSLSLSLLSFLSSCILIYSHPPVPAAPHISHRASQHPHPDPRPHVASSHAQPHRLQRRPPKSSSSPLPGTRWHRSA